VKRAHARITSALGESAADLLAYLQRRVGPDEAPDLLGETMVVAWRRVDDLPSDPERARMWLFGIARNTLFNADDGSEVRDAIARLDDDLAELIQLVHWERMTITQAAAVIGISDSTARSRYARAKEHLRTALRVSTS
jgi:DNA-directed RNA polymerase specialized sigma24 family protein